MIYKEDNVYGDREVDEYIVDNAFMELLEAQRIKEQIRNFEHVSKLSLPYLPSTFRAGSTYRYVSFVRILSVNNEVEYYQRYS